MFKTKPANENPEFESFDDLLEDFIGLAKNTIGKKEDLFIPDIIEFVKKFLDLGNIELTTQQFLVLKCLYNIPLSEQDLSILEYWKTLDKTSYDFDDDAKQHQVLILECGRRAAKTTIAGIIATYEFFCLVRYGNPQAHFGIASGSPIGILCLATTAEQAKKTIFRQVTGLIRSVPFLVEMEKKGEIFIGKEEISCESKQVYLYAGNSKSASQVGANLKGLIMDEVARFQSADGDNNALELWSNLGIAGAPFRNNAIRVAISSAWEEGDAIQTLYNNSKISSSMIGFSCCSWDLNPIIAARDNPVIAAEYDADPIQAALEFENIRPTSARAFLDTKEVLQSFTGKSVIEVESVLVYEPSPLVSLQILKCENTQNYSSVIHIDPAIKKDSYALAMGHLKESKEKDSPVVIIDFICAWEPSFDSQVKLSNVYELIQEIASFRNISKVTADHFNSAETIQKLNASGLLAESVFFSNRLQVQMYDTVRTLLHENRLILPDDSQWSNILKTELTKVELKNGGTKIDHPKNGSKDIADAVAAVCYYLLGNKNTTQKSSMPFMTSHNQNTASFDSKQKLFSSIPRSGNQWYKDKSKKFDRTIRKPGRGWDKLI